MTPVNDLLPRDWRDQAACCGVDPEVFFPASSPEGAPVWELVLARHVCGQCDVRTQCLRYAVLTGQQLGIWGGLTPAERRSLTGDDSEPGDEECGQGSR